MIDLLNPTPYPGIKQCLIDATEAFLAKIIVQPLAEGGCWLWQERLGKPFHWRGYQWQPRRFAVRRFLRELGTTEGDHQVRAACGNLLCINPEHSTAFNPPRAAVIPEVADPVCAIRILEEKFPDYAERRARGGLAS